MRTGIILICAWYISAIFNAEAAGKPFDIRTARATIEKLAPLHKRMASPNPGEWLSMHAEAGQTFEEYVVSRPRRPTAERNIIYIQPLGDFTREQSNIVCQTAEYLEHYFNVPVRICKARPLSEIPEKARRTHPFWGDKQILTTYVLHEMLKPELPKDAAVFISFTAEDLWPGKDWNFVFGQASLRERVGVWSIYRNGNPAAGSNEYKSCLARTLKTAVHETGHMFSMKHCTAYECCMCGSNSREESDRRPLALCPECMAKICWATNANAEERYRSLMAYCEKNGLEKEAVFFKKSIKILVTEPEPEGKAQ